MSLKKTIAEVMLVGLRAKAKVYGKLRPSQISLHLAVESRAIYAEIQALKKLVQYSEAMDKLKLPVTHMCHGIVVEDLKTCAFRDPGYKCDCPDHPEEGKDCTWKLRQIARRKGQLRHEQ